MGRFACLPAAAGGGQSLSDIARLVHYKLPEPGGNVYLCDVDARFWGWKAWKEQSRRVQFKRNNPLHFPDPGKDGRWQRPKKLASLTI